MRHLLASWRIAQGQASGGHSWETPMGLWGDVGVRGAYGGSPERVSLLGHSAKLGDVSQWKHVGMQMHDACVCIDMWSQRVCVCVCVYTLHHPGWFEVTWSHMTGFCADLILDGLVASPPWGCLRCHTPCVTNSAPSPLSKTHTACQPASTGYFTVS